MQKYPDIVCVTEIGEVIGHIPYEMAHKKDSVIRGVRHLSSNMFIFETNSYDRILLTERAKEISNAGKLNVCTGGHAVWIENENRAQTPLETAVLEMNEEVFYEKSPPAKLEIEEICKFVKDIRINDSEFVFLFNTIYSGPFSMNPYEVSDCFFKDIKEVRRELQLHPERYVKSAGIYLDKLLKHVPSSTSITL